MAIAFVNQASTTNTSATTINLGKTCVAGNWLIVFLNVAGAITNATVVDNLGNFLIPGPTKTNTSMLCSFYYRLPSSSVTGFTANWTTARASSIAVVEYSGAAGLNANLAGNTASATSTSATITVTTEDANDFIVVGFGDSALTLTASVGTGRVQVVTTPKQTVVDNTVASAGNLTCTATTSSSAWTAIALELRTAVFTVFESDTMTITEAPLSLGTKLELGKPRVFTDTMTFTGDAFAKALLDASILLENLSDAMTITDGTVTHPTDDWLLAIGCPHLGDNWLDAYAQSLAGGSTPITENLSDSMTITDFLRAGYGLATSDQLIFVDSTSAGYAGLFSDQMAMSDSLGAGYGSVFNDSINNWLDSVNFAMVLGYAFNDTLVFLDFVAAGYGNVFNDQLILTDSTSSGYAGLFNDTMSFSDRLGVGYGNLHADQMAFTDAEVNQLSLLEILADAEGANWLDSLGVGYGNIFNDQLILADSIGAGYGAVLSDNDNFWADAFAFSFSGGITLQLSDTLLLLDFMGLGYGALNSDQLIFADSISSGYAGILSDQLTMTDAEINVLGKLEIFADTMSMSDFLGAGYGNVFNDQLVLTESIGAGYGAILSDSDSFWADAFVFSTGGGLFESLSDTLVFTDFAQLGYGNATSDQIVFVDSITSGYANLLSDQIVMTDSFADLLGLIEALSDNEGVNWNDRLGLGYGDSISDQLTLADSLTAGYGAATSDQIVFVDSMNAGYGAQTSDTMTMSDGIIDVIGLNEILTDQDTTWLDSITAGYGLANTDQFNMTDALGIGYGLLITDNEGNNWLDQFDFSSGGGISIQFSDTLTMTDLMRLGYGMLNSDQLVIVDSLSTGYAGLLSDTMALSDALSFVYGLGKLVSDSLTMAEILGLGYGNSIFDALNASDFVAAGYGNIFNDQLILTDSINSGYAGLFNDTMSMSDSFADQMALLKALTDQDSGWNDALGIGYGMAIADNGNFWTELFQIGGQNGIGLQFADSLTLADFMGLGYGALTSDQLVIVDSVGAGYGSILSDQMVLTDVERNVLGLQEQITDAIQQADNMKLGYGLLMNDDEGSNWADSFIDVIHSTDLALNLFDSLAQLDTLAIGHGFLVNDSTMFWQDNFAEQLLSGTNLIQMIFTDVMGQLWQDSVIPFFVGTIIPALAYRVGTRPTMKVQRVLAETAINAYKVRTRNSIIVQKVLAFV